jgi:DNA-binding SARP family transcriptional activator
VLEFRVLGPLEVLRDGSGVPLGGHKLRAVLAFLLLNANRVVSTETLVDALWGEQPPKTATASLQNSISQLRKLLGADVVVTRAPGYALTVEADAIDLVRFEQLVRRAGGEEAAARATTLRDALALWRGEPLADVAYESFADAEARRLEELRLVALEERIDADLELGRHAELVGELEQLVRAQPVRERLRGQLMLALYRSNRQTEALEAFQDARRRLDDDLGIAPGSALRELHSAILRQERTLLRATPAAAVADHFGDVVKALVAARLVPVLGPTAVAEASGDEETPRVANGGRSPFDADVASYLADLFECPPEDPRELARVSQYVMLTRGIGPLYDELHALLDRDDAPGEVHELLAALPRLLRARGLPHQLIVSAGYDETIECAFAAAGEEIDVVSYVATGRDRGRFLHSAPDGTSTVVAEPNTYAGLSLEQRTVLLKIHGQVDRRPERDLESFVVSEDDYIDYLAGADLASIVPVTLAAKLRRSHFLFFGYPVRGWNLRVFLRRVWGVDKVAYRSWAVEPEPDILARELWAQRGVELYAVSVDEYAQELRRRVEAVLSEAVQAP